MMDTVATTNAAYKSVSHRLLSMKALREAVFLNTRFDKTSTLLRFECDAVLQDNISSTALYYRESTHTWVWKLRDENGILDNCVLKIFLLASAKPARGRQKTDGVGNGKNHEIEVRFLQMFSSMARSGLSPHVVLPIGHTTFSAEQVRLVLNSKQRVPDGEYMVLLSECADASLYSDMEADNLSPYNLKVLIFQVVYTLMVIQDTFSSFRHNDLHLSNVLTQALQSTGVDRYILGSDDLVYIDLQRAPRRALLWDMFFSSISYADAKKYSLQEDHVVPSAWVESRHCPNNYYDLHKFFDSLEFTLSKKAKDDFVEERALIDLVVPEHLKCLSKNRTRDERRHLKLWEQCIMRPADVLALPYFQELRTRPPGKRIIKQYSREASRLKSLATKSES